MSVFSCYNLNGKDKAMNGLIAFLRKNRELFMGISDAMMVCVSYFLAYFLRMDFGKIVSSETLNPVINNIVWVLIINMAFLLLFKVNQTLWQYISVDEVIRVVVAVACANGLWLLLILLIPIAGYPRSVPIIAGMILVLLMLGIRILYRIYRRNQMQSGKKHRAVIIGAGSAGALALRDLTLSNRYDAKIIGFVDDNPSKKGKIISGVEVLGSIEDLENIQEKFNIDRAFIAIKNISKEDLKGIVEKCRNINLATKIVSFETVDSDKGITQVRDVSIDDLLGRGEIKLDNSGIRSYLTGKTIMVTGGGGSIGSELVRQILRFHPKQIILVDIYENCMYDVQQEVKIDTAHGLYPADVEMVCLIGSIRDKARIDEIMEKYHPSVVFHAAAHKHVPLVEGSPEEAIKNNVFGTNNVIRSCIEHGVERFVQISTDKAVNPTNVMGATKRMCEILVQGYRNNGVTKLCAVRFGNVLGSHGSVIPLFKEQIEKGGPVTVTDPNIIRYFMTIPEAAQLVLQAGMYAQSGEIFVLDMGTPVKIADLAENMIRLSGFIPNVDIAIEYTGLRPGEKMYEELNLDREKQTKTENDLIFVNEPSDFTEADIQKKLGILKNVLDTHGDYRETMLNVIK